MDSSQKEHIDALVEDWLRVDVNEASSQEIKQLQVDGEYDVLHSKLAKRIAFGTAGLRSSMESGFAHMNDVTILQASQGLVRYVLDQWAPTPENSAGPSIVVGYDHRFHSQRFAEITASVALVSGLVVYYLGSATHLSAESAPSASSDAGDRSYVHTPMVPFAIDHFGASAGVMVTASHNPAQDNGYKVYFGNGCQIIPPHDAGIAHSIQRNLEPWLDRNVWDVQANFAAGKLTGQLVAVKEQLSAAYIDAVQDQLVHDPSVSYKFVYTPMHGVGQEMFGAICERMGVQFVAVDAQQHPDPTFPTVKFPNPEEAGALDLAIATAKEHGLQLVVASDPDADRFSVAVDIGGTWRQLTGNEIGILFAAYVVEELTPAKQLSQTYLVNSTVSSQLLKSMAEKTGCHYEDTLTGFKWIGNKAIDLKKAGFQVPFAYEEAIGYMFSLVNDKDGLSAAVVWMQLYEKWFAGGRQAPVEKLEEIYSKYGWFKECNGYYKLSDMSATGKIFGEIRSSYGEGRQFPEKLGHFEVLQWRDLTVGYESSTADHVPQLPVDATSQMITAVVQAGENERVRFTCRGSGTEPKLKVYIEGTSAQSGDRAQELARQCWTVLKSEWFKPELNGLQEVV